MEWKRAKIGLKCCFNTNWWLKAQTHCTAQLCRKESNLLLIKPALQRPVGVQVSMAAVAAHCREKETLLRHLTPSSCGGDGVRETAKRNGITSICLWCWGRGRGGRRQSCGRFLNHVRQNQTLFHECCFGMYRIRTRLTDEEVVLRLPAVLQTVDKWMFELPLCEHKSILGFCQNVALVHTLHYKWHTKFTIKGAKKNYLNPNNVTDKSK